MRKFNIAMSATGKLSDTREKSSYHYPTLITLVATSKYESNDTNYNTPGTCHNMTFIAHTFSPKQFFIYKTQQYHSSHSSQLRSRYVASAYSISGKDSAVLPVPESIVEDALLGNMND